MFKTPLIGLVILALTFPVDFSLIPTTGGILNIGNEGQSRLDQDEDQVLYLDSMLGRTLFLTTKFDL